MSDELELLQFSFSDLLTEETLPLSIEQFDRVLATIEEKFPYDREAIEGDEFYVRAETLEGDPDEFVLRIGNGRTGENYIGLPFVVDAELGEDFPEAVHESLVDIAEFAALNLKLALNGSVDPVDGNRIGELAGEANWGCGICDKIFMLYHDLARHVEQSHPDEVENKEISDYSTLAAANLIKEQETLVGKRKFHSFLQTLAAVVDSDYSLLEQQGSLDEYFLPFFNFHTSRNQLHMEVTLKGHVTGQDIGTFHVRLRKGPDAMLQIQQMQYEVSASLRELTTPEGDEYSRLLKVPYWACDFCTEELHSFAELRAHINEVHLKKDEQNSSDDLDVDITFDSDDFNG